MADDNWDLFAVVRSCCCSSSTTTTTATVATSSPLDHYNNSLSAAPLTNTSMLQTNSSTRVVNEDLQDLYKPFLTTSTNTNTSTSTSNVVAKPVLSPLSVLAGLNDVSPTPVKDTQQPSMLFPVKRNGVMAGVHVTTPTTKSKRRKIQKKTVCQVAAEDLSSDTWSWRKYGQKPIKGSPYPRGYYKCSTSKGCLARKQVERNRSDPGMFIVTYNADHNHPMPTNRSTLSGISRLKPDGPSMNADPTTTTEKREVVEGTEDLPEVNEEEDQLGGSDNIVGDDFFEGLEEFTRSGYVNNLLDHYPEIKTPSAGGGGG